MQRKFALTLAVLFGVAFLAGCCGRSRCCPDRSPGGGPDDVVIEDVTDEQTPEQKLAGTYVLDREAMRESLKAMMPEGQPPEMLEQMLSQIDITITINADGTWTGVAKGGDGDASEAGGTYEIKGDKLHMHETKSKGKPDDPDTQIFTLVEGGFEAKPEGAPFTMKLVKQ